MANNKIVNNKNKETKLAPVFVINSKEKINNVFDNKSDNKLKRKKKSLKCENNNKHKVIKKYNNIEEKSLSDDCRRSRRLRDKVLKNELFMNNNEVIIEENAENSNTIDYWNDNCLKQLHQNKDIDEIEVIYSQTSNGSEQESLKTYLPSIDGQKECLLWTEKYKPMNSCEVIGHKIAVNKLKSWLEVWNNRDNKVEANTDDESYDCFDESNTCLLICGPTGSGKTSLVYAIAEELKYEVLEMNASIKRNGRIISKIVGEATQSHHMQRTNQSIPSHSIFPLKTNNNITDSEVKVVKVVKRSKKPKNKGILNYFSKQNTSKSVENTSVANELEIIDCDEEVKAFDKCENVLKMNEKSSNDIMICSPKVLSFTSNSLILFDDVDVMIDEDFNSFWSAVNKINEITKKPVILTATQFIPYIKECVTRLQVLALNIPDHNETVNALKNICDKEIDCKEEEEIGINVCEHLSNTYNHDIRRCINELQFNWNQLKDFEPQSDNLIEDLSNPISCYDSLIFTDIMETKFNILSSYENRELWMKSKPTLIEDDNQNVCLAKDIINTIKELTENINYNNDVIIKSNELLPIDSESIDSIQQFLTKNTSLRTILLDYCPYLSFICESESVRQSETANHSRKSRRFMHHLDSIGFYIANELKNKLISTFISEPQTTQSYELNENSVKINETIDLNDNDFYD